MGNFFQNLASFGSSPFRNESEETTTQTLQNSGVDVEAINKQVDTSIEEQSVKTLSKDKVTDIIRNAPEGTDPKQVITGLLDRGFNLEGLDPDDVTEMRQAEEQPDDGFTLADFPEDEVETEAEEDISGLDIGVQAGEAIREGAGIFKFDSNVDDGVIESGAKFLANVPANTVQLGGDIISIVSDPLGTAKSLHDLASGLSDKLVFGTLNSIFGTDVSPTEQAVMVDSIAGELKKISDTPGGIKGLLVENPADVLLAVTGGLGIAKNVAKTKGLTGLATKLDQAQKLTNPLNVIKAEAKLAKSAVELVPKAIGATLRTVTPKSISKSIANIDKVTSNVLAKTSKSELDAVLKTTTESLGDIEKPQAFAKAGEKASAVVDELKVQANLAGKAKVDALKTVANKEIDIAPIIDKFDDLLSDRFNVRVSPDGTLVGIEGKIPKSLDELQKFSDALGELRTTPSGKINLSNLDSLVDNLQAIFRKAKIDRPGANLTTAEKTIEGFVGGTVNKTLKEAAGSKFIKANEDFKKVFDLSQNLEKALGPKGTRASGLFKSLFGSGGENARQIIKEARIFTGVDLGKEAVLAKFAMEALGDTKSLSLIEAAIGAKTGFISPSLVQKALQTIFKPEKIAGSLTKKKGLGKVKATSSAKVVTKPSEVKNAVGDLMDEIARKTGGRADFLPELIEAPIRATVGNLLDVLTGTVRTGAIASAGGKGVTKAASKFSAGAKGVSGTVQEGIAKGASKSGLAETKKGLAKTAKIAEKSKAIRTEPKNLRSQISEIEDLSTLRGSVGGFKLIDQPSIPKSVQGILRDINTLTPEQFASKMGDAIRKAKFKKDIMPVATNITKLFILSELGVKDGIINQLKEAFLKPQPKLKGNTPRG